MTDYKPMLAASIPSSKRRVPTQDEVIADFKRLDWSRGFWASPKMDGIRAIKDPRQGLISRTLKPIPNLYVQWCLASPIFDMLDGELILGKWNEHVSYNDNQSAFMSAGGEPKFSFCVFDDVEYPDYTFRWRNRHAFEKCVWINGFDNPDNPKMQFELHHLEQVHCANIEQLMEYEARIVELGFEGVIVRDMGGRYKHGRSTFLEQGMIKLKRYLDAEGIIVGFEELLINDNAPTIDNLGYQKRSGHLDGMRPADTLGKLRLRITGGEFEGAEVACGSGLDDSLRFKIWQNRAGYEGKIVKFKYQSVGSKNLPRTPIFLGFRDPKDI